MSRYNLSLRRFTSLFKLEEHQIIDRAIALKKFFDKIDFAKYDKHYMITMDEPAVFLGNTDTTTVDSVGSSSVYLKSTGYESARLTCILAIRLDGSKARLFIVTKGKTESTTLKDGVYIKESGKAWITQDVVKSWVDDMLPLFSRGQRRTLLLRDAASTHRAKAMKTFSRPEKLTK